MGAKLIIFFFTINAWAFDFQEVKPQYSSQWFRQYIQEALEEINENQTAIARFSLKMITHKKVKIDQLRDLTFEDFQHILDDYIYEGQEPPFTLKDYYRLHQKNSPVLKKLRSEMYGYMWDNRIYVSLNQTADSLAKTLVHEINHVINESHLAYYQSTEQDFIEEYRAFYAEALYDEKPVRSKKFSKKLKQEVIDLYQFAGLDPDDFRDLPPGYFYRWDLINDKK